ncbi:hypothetical protein BDR06DRAFT_363674 [Suillus hirtellus]|nr:hypothetical protein BDR06DRAFT_363674 [Suillus hirtellus]
MPTTPTSLRHWNSQKPHFTSCSPLSLTVSLFGDATCSTTEASWSVSLVVLCCWPMERLGTILSGAFLEPSQGRVFIPPFLG